MEKTPTVIDIFCGAGGFSEGFRQQGFEILLGIDKWEPAIKTFKHNFRSSARCLDVLELSNDLGKIEALPDTEVIIGSPPCVSFSNSNRSGKADKSRGLRLTEAFLKIVVIKKFKKGSKLKAWFMENVPNSLKYIQTSYTFKDLELGHWASLNGRSPIDVAIVVEGNSLILNSAEFGAAQARKRAITGEIIRTGKMVSPQKTHSLNYEPSNLKKAIPVRRIRGRMPRPNVKCSKRRIIDPQYPSIRIRLDELTDHFYDTGIYESQWRESRFMKCNHPYMGRMAFPENEKKPSRTVTAVSVRTSREALIYRSEYQRKGDGEYRAPTIREVAVLMGFPYTYQFLGGGEGSKRRLIGNAVCVSVSRALAKSVRQELGLRELDAQVLSEIPDLDGVLNLNEFKEKSFSSPPKKNPGSRFRRHPFKDGNITVSLSNYNINRNSRPRGKWYTSVQYGNGAGFPSYNVPDGYYSYIRKVILECPNGKKFLDIIDNSFMDGVANSKALQKMYEEGVYSNGYHGPTNLVEEVNRIIRELLNNEIFFNQTDTVVFKDKQRVPLSQLFALYAINKACSKANM